MANNQVAQQSGSKAVQAKRVRPYTADFAQIQALIGTEDTNDSFRLDLQMPRGLLKAVAAAYLGDVTMGVNPTAATILAGPNKDSVVEALENACHECAARKTPRVIVPLVNEAKSQLRQIIADLFLSPDKISAKIKKPAIPYELEFVGKKPPQVTDQSAAGKKA